MRHIFSLIGPFDRYSDFKMRCPKCRTPSEVITEELDEGDNAVTILCPDCGELNITHREENESELYCVETNEPYSMITEITDAYNKITEYLESGGEDNNEIIRLVQNVVDLYDVINIDIEESIDENGFLLDLLLETCKKDSSLQDRCIKQAVHFAGILLSESYADEAMEALFQVKKYIKSKETRVVADYYLTMGHCYYLKEEYKKSETYLLKGLKILNKLYGDEIIEDDPYIRVYAWDTLSFIQLDLPEKRRDFSYMEKSIEERFKLLNDRKSNLEITTDSLGACAFYATNCSDGVSDYVSDIYRRYMSHFSKGDEDEVLTWVLSAYQYLVFLSASKDEKLDEFTSLADDLIKVCEKHDEEEYQETIEDVLALKAGETPPSMLKMDEEIEELLKAMESGELDDIDFDD